jgi:hypothetical protein
MSWLTNRLLKQRTVLTRPPRRANARLFPSKAAGKKQPEASPSQPPTLSCRSSSFPTGYVEDCFDLRRPLGGCFSGRQVVIC